MVTNASSSQHMWNVLVCKDTLGNILSNFKKIYDHMLRTRKGKIED